MYRLYYYPLNASMAPHMVLNAIGAEHRLYMVDRKSEAQKSVDYMKLNPTGRIPTLVDGDQAIFESAAICVHLAEIHPEANLIPEIGSDERALFFQWLMYLTSTLQAELMIYFYPGRHMREGAETGHAVRQQEARLMEMWKLLDAELADRPFLVGQTPSVCDYFLFMLAIWSDELPKPALAFANLNPYLKKIARLPAVVNACEVEGFSLQDYK